jgi:hypothetical protein
MNTITLDKTHRDYADMTTFFLLLSSCTLTIHCCHEKTLNSDRNLIPYLG